MEVARFSWQETAAGWRVTTDYPGLEAPLEGALRYELRLGELPAAEPLVGHCSAMGLWCVFWREAGGAAVTGAAVRPDVYARFAFDPYLAACELLGAGFLAEVAAAATSPAAPGDRDEGHLVEAYRLFLAAPPTARRAPYVSLRPAGAPQRSSPLTTRVEPGAQPTAPAEPAADPDPLPAPRPAPSPEPIAPRAGDLGPPGSELRCELAALQARLYVVEREAERSRGRSLLVGAALLLLAAALVAGLLRTDRRLRRLEPPPAAAASAAPELG